MKVYVFVQDEILECDEIHSLKVFSNIEDAKKHLKAFVDDKDTKEWEKCWKSKYDFEEEQDEWVVDSETEYSVWECGYYATNHIHYWIEEQEVC